MAYMTSKRASFKNRTVFIDGVETDNGYLDCPYCEDTFHYFDGEIDHIHPHSQGGSNNKYNLILVCRNCNQAKHSMPLHVFCYTHHITPEAVYTRLKKAGKSIPLSMLKYLGYEE